VVLRALHSILAEHSFGLELVHQLDLPNVLLIEGERMVLLDDLNP